MASIHDDPIALLLLGSGPSGVGMSRLQGAMLTAWDSVTYANTVTTGSAIYQDVIVLNPSLLILGRVLLAFTDDGIPVILGNSYQTPPPTPPEL
jgi:hypothetical protein